MVDAILALGADAERRRRLGRAGRRFAETHLDRERIIARYVADLVAQAAARARRSRWRELRSRIAARLPQAPAIGYGTAPPELNGPR
jgi:hypothetical protein